MNLTVNPVGEKPDAGNRHVRFVERQFEARHPIGTKARLALALLLFTGPRRGEVVTFSAPQEWRLALCAAQDKLQTQVAFRKAVVPDPPRIIAASPTGDQTFLVTEYGKPFTAAGFGASPQAVR